MAGYVNDTDMTDMQQPAAPGFPTAVEWGTLFLNGEPVVLHQTIYFNARRDVKRVPWAIRNHANETYPLLAIHPAIKRYCDGVFARGLLIPRDDVLDVTAVRVQFENELLSLSPAGDVRNFDPDQKGKDSKVPQALQVKYETSVSFGRGEYKLFVLGVRTQGTDANPGGTYLLSPPIFMDYHKDKIAKAFQTFFPNALNPWADSLEKKPKIKREPGENRPMFGGGAGAGAGAGAEVQDDPMDTGLPRGTKRELSSGEQSPSKRSSTVVSSWNQPLAMAAHNARFISAWARGEPETSSIGNSVVDAAADMVLVDRLVADASRDPPRRPDDVMFGAGAGAPPEDIQLVAGMAGVTAADDFLVASALAAAEPSTPVYFECMVCGRENVGKSSMLEAMGSTYPGRMHEQQRDTLSNVNLDFLRNMTHVVYMVETRFDLGDYDALEYLTNFIPGRLRVVVRMHLADDVERDEAVLKVRNRFAGALEAFQTLRGARYVADVMSNVYLYINDEPELSMRAWLSSQTMPLN